MNNKIELQLIDGLFEPTEAVEVLSSLFRNKIQFHEMKNFKTLEQTGLSNPDALQRVEKLKESLSQLHTFITSQQGQELQIQSQILLQSQ